MNVSDLTFTDADQYVHVLKVCRSSRNCYQNSIILQCVLPCICDLLGQDSALVHCIRAYQQYFTMVSMTVMTSDRLERLQKYIEIYERYCEVSHVIPTLNLEIYLT